MRKKKSASAVEACGKYGCAMGALSRQGLRIGSSLTGRIEALVWREAYRGSVGPYLTGLYALAAVSGRDFMGVYTDATDADQHRKVSAHRLGSDPTVG